MLVLSILPALAAAILVFLAIYHLWPLLRLLPSLASKLANAIPHPGANLPRSHFNLAPRTRPSLLGKLGVRSAIILVLVFNASLSLASGWAIVVDTHLAARPALLALAVTPLPWCIAVLAAFSVTHQRHAFHHTQPNGLARAVGAGGGLTVATVIPRVLPLSLIIPGVAAGICMGVPPSTAEFVALVFSSCSSAFALGLIGLGWWRARRQGAVGLRLDSPACSTPGISSRPLSPGSKTPEEAHHPSTEPTTPPRPRTRSTNPSGSPNSWISSPSPSTLDKGLPEWSWSLSPGSDDSHYPYHARPSSPTPQQTQRKRGALPTSRHASTTAVHTSTPKREYPHKLRLSRAPKNSSTPHKRGHSRTKTSTSTAQSHSFSISIVGGYEPDPFHPLPRGFESLASFPRSASMEANEGDDWGREAKGSGSTLGMAVMPLERTPSATWTLAPYRNSRTPTSTEGTVAEGSTQDQAAGAQNRTAGKSSLPASVGSRGSQPPVLPIDLPSALGDWAHDSDAEPGWITVDDGGEMLDDWGSGDRGTAVMAVLSVVLCYGLSVPLLAVGPSTAALASFVAGLIFPAPFLVGQSYIVHQRVPVRTFMSSSDLVTAIDSTEVLPTFIPHLRITNLTPRAAAIDNTRRHNSFRESTLSPDSRYPSHRHTVYTEYANAHTDPALVRRLHQSSTDVWLLNGHARQGLSGLGRAVEMSKPRPALSLSPPPRTRPQSMLGRLRGGVVSMIVTPVHGGAGLAIDPNASPDPRHRVIATGPIPTIAVISPSGRLSTDSTGFDSGVGAEIQTATRGRRSASPSIILSWGDKQRLDWMSPESTETVVAPPPPTATASTDNAMPLFRPSLDQATSGTPPKVISHVKAKYSHDSVSLHSPGNAPPHISTPNLEGAGIDFSARLLTQPLNRPAKLIELFTTPARKASQETQASIERNAALARLILARGESVSAEDREAARQWSALESSSFLRDVTAGQSFLAQGKDTPVSVGASSPPTTGRKRITKPYLPRMRSRERATDFFLRSQSKGKKEGGEMIELSTVPSTKPSSTSTHVHASHPSSGSLASTTTVHSSAYSSEYTDSVDQSFTTNSSVTMPRPPPLPPLPSYIKDHEYAHPNPNTYAPFTGPYPSPPPSAVLFSPGRAPMQAMMGILSPPRTARHAKEPQSPTRNANHGLPSPTKAPQSPPRAAASGLRPLRLPKRVANRRSVTGDSADARESLLEPPPGFTIHADAEQPAGIPRASTDTFGHVKESTDSGRIPLAELSLSSGARSSTETSRARAKVSGGTFNTGSGRSVAVSTAHTSYASKGSKASKVSTGSGVQSKKGSTKSSIAPVALVEGGNVRAGRGRHVRAEVSGIRV